MTKKELAKNLTDALANFDRETSLFTDEYSNAPASKSDLREFARQTSYALRAFKDSLLDYLD